MRPLVSWTQALADRWGCHAQLDNIGRRLTCQQCGRRADRLMLGHEQAAVPESVDRDRA